MVKYPGVDTSLTSEEFSECVAALLCLPSPACTPLIGRRVGRASVDKYGDDVMAAALQGDGWRRRHDCIKMRLFGLLRWAGIEVDLEVFNIFSGLLWAHSTARSEQTGARTKTPGPCARLSSQSARWKWRRDSRVGAS